MSRITVVLFHLVLTASVTVWANNERQLTQVGQEPLEDSAASDQAVLPVVEPPALVEGVSEVSYPEVPIQSQNILSEEKDQDLVSAPSI